MERRDKKDGKVKGKKVTFFERRQFQIHFHICLGLISLERTFKLRVDLIQANLDLRNSIFPFLNQELFDLRKSCVLNSKTSCTKKCHVKKCQELNR